MNMLPRPEAGPPRPGSSGEPPNNVVVGDASRMRWGSGNPAAAARSPAENAPGGSVDLLDLWRIAWRRRWIVLGCGLLVAAVTAVMVSRRPIGYAAYATLRIEGRNSQPVPALDLLRGTDEEVDTDLEMVQSKTLIQTVVDSLGLRLTASTLTGDAPWGRLLDQVRVDSTVADSARRDYLLVRTDRGHMQVQDAVSGAKLAVAAPGQTVSVAGVSFRLRPPALEQKQISLRLRTTDAAVNAVSAGLDVDRAARGAKVIRVGFIGADPFVAQAVPNALVAAFIHDRVLTAQAGARSTAEFLRDQIAKLSSQLTAAEDSLRTYREAHGIVSLPDEASTGVSRTAALVSQRNEFAAERTALAQLVDRANARAKEPRAPGAPSAYRSLLAFPTLLRNPAAGALLSEIGAAEGRRTELLTRRAPTDPEVQFLDSRVSQLETQLHEVVVTYLTGLANQVTALDATIAQSTRQLAGIPGKQVEFARLERKVKTLETFVAQLQSRLKEAEVAEAAQDPSVGVLDMARRPTSPIHRHRLLWTAVGLVGGMVVGLVLAFGLEYLDETVHSRGDVMVATGTPVVGLVPKIKRRQKTLLIAPSGGAATGGRLRRSRPTGRGRPGKTVTPRKQLSSPAQREQVEMLAEAYDQIETNIALTYPTREMKLLLVTSPLPGDGKTTSAVNLALSLAQRGERVVLIDADLRRGTLASAFHVATEPGLTDLLCGEMLLESVLRSQPLAGDRALYFMTTGRRHAHPGQVLKSDQLRAMLERLREECDRVVIDTPPINVVSDAAIIGRLVDGVIVVARAGATPFPALVSMAEACRSAGVPVIGTVLNGIDFDRDASYDRAYQWYGLGRSYYAAGQSRSERP